MIVNRLMKLPNDHAYARRFQKPAATQNQISARMTAQKTEPHCASAKQTALPTNVKLATPAKTSARQTSNRPARPASQRQDRYADGSMHRVSASLMSSPPSGVVVCGQHSADEAGETVRSAENEALDTR